MAAYDIYAAVNKRTAAIMTNNIVRLRFSERTKIMFMAVYHYLLLDRVDR